MLRITAKTTNGSSVTLKLEGKIKTDWVNILERECRTLISQRKNVVLDFSDVVYIDHSGVGMVRKLPNGKVTIVNAPDFITDLLQREA